MTSSENLIGHHAAVAVDLKFEVEVDPFYCIIGCMTAIKVATIKNKVVFNTGSKSIRTKHVSQRASGGLQSKSAFISLREPVII